jgi:hypothetical protein
MIGDVVCVEVGSTVERSLFQSLHVRPSDCGLGISEDVISFERDQIKSHQHEKCTVHESVPRSATYITCILVLFNHVRRNSYTHHRDTN